MRTIIKGSTCHSLPIAERRPTPPAWLATAHMTNGRTGTATARSTYPHDGRPSLSAPHDWATTKDTVMNSRTPQKRKKWCGWVSISPTSPMPWTWVSSPM